MAHYCGTQRVGRDGRPGKNGRPGEPGKSIQGPQGIGSDVQGPQGPDVVAPGSGPIVGYPITYIKGSGEPIVVFFELLGTPFVTYFFSGGYVFLDENGEFEFTIEFPHDVLSVGGSISVCDAATALIYQSQVSVNSVNSILIKNVSPLTPSLGCAYTGNLTIRTTV